MGETKEIESFKSPIEFAKALADGKRVRHKSWVKSVSIYIGKGGCALDESNFPMPWLVLDIMNFSAWCLAPEPPQVIEFELDSPIFAGVTDSLKQLNGKRWKITATELREKRK